MAKCHKLAFHLLLIHPGDMLLMECSVSCSTFEEFSSFLEWALKENIGHPEAVLYLADSSFAGSLGPGNCAHILVVFIELASGLGVPLA